MPWNGSGSFSRTDGTRTGTTVWQQAKAAAVNILSSDHDTHDQDLATGINACLAKNGENAATGDIDLDGNDLILDSDGDSKLLNDVANELGLQLNGTEYLRLKSTHAEGNIIADILRDHVGGLVLSNDAGDTDHDINVTAGICVDTTGVKVLRLSSEITKQIDASWAVGDDAGGLDGTESVAGTPDADTIYYVWLILRSDTGVVDVLFSESATLSGVSLPTNYDYGQLIGAVITDGSANVLSFLHVGDEFRLTGDVVQDISDSSITDDTYEDGVVSVPASCLGHFYGRIINSSGNDNQMYLNVRTKGAADDTNTQEAVIAGQPSTTSVLYGTAFDCMVNSSSTLQYAGTENSGAAQIDIRTFGWRMLTRGRMTS